MGLFVRRVKKFFGFDKEKNLNYVLVPDRGDTVTMKYICEHAALSSGVNLGMVQIVSYALVEAMKAYIQQGHAVQIDSFGKFIPTFSAKSSAVESEVNLKSVRSIRLRFAPCKELQKIVKEIELVFNAKDSTQDTKAANQEETPSDPEDEEIF